MTDTTSKEESFINRKRPALESIVEDLLGPTTQIDEIISGNPFPPVNDQSHKKLHGEKKDEKIEK